MQDAILNVLADAAQQPPIELGEPVVVKTKSASKSSGSRARKGKKQPKGKKAVREQGEALRPPLMPKPAAYVLTDDAKERLAALGVVLQKSADNIFVIGEVMVPAQEAIPEKSWAKAIRTLGLTVKTAYNYMSVFRCLSDHRTELIEANVGPTVMYQLARSPGVVTQVIEAYSRGERLSVASVRRLVNESLGILPQPIADALNLGGMSGLRRAAAAKQKADIAEFVRLIRIILALVEEAMKPIAVGKRVKKGPLAEAIVYDCRHACDLVNAIAAPLDAAAPTRHLNLAPNKLPADSGWGKVQALLYKLGAEATWPAADALESWLTDEVVPMLRFVAFGEPMPGVAPDADIATSVEVTAADESAKEALASSRTAFNAEAESVVDGAATAATESERMVLAVPSLTAEEPVDETTHVEAVFEPLG